MRPQARWRTYTARRACAAGGVLHEHDREVILLLLPKPDAAGVHADLVPTIGSTADDTFDLEELN